MSYARQMLDACRRTFNVDAGLLAATIDTLNDCAQACLADTGCDLSEQNVTELVRCIRLCQDCADVCTAAAAVTSRQTDPDANVTKPLLEACEGRLQELRRRVRAACPDARALPGLRRSLLALRAGLPRAPGRHEIADRATQPTRAGRPA